MRGQFVIIEGIDGSGKSTLAQSLKKSLELEFEKSFQTNPSLLKDNQSPQVTLTEEPGGSELGRSIRQLLKQSGESLDGLTELLLLLTARYHHFYQVIEPALKRGDWVICDRFIASTYAYQGYGRGVEMALIKKWHQQTLGFDFTTIAHPHTHIFIKIPPKLAIKRRNQRLNERLINHKAQSGQATDRFESEGLGFYEKISQGYQALFELAKQEGKPCLQLDGNLSAKELSAQSLEHLKTLTH